MSFDKQKKTILLVDDNKTNLLYLSTICQEHFENATILEAISAKDALLLLKSHHVEIILSDVNMPEINGFEFAKQLKQNYKTKDIPIIFVTAHENLDEFEEKTIDIDAYDYIKKPVKLKKSCVSAIANTQL